MQYALECTNYDGNLYYKIPSGYYSSPYSTSDCEVRIGLDKVRTAIGYTNPDKVLDDTTIAGLKGTFPLNKNEIWGTNTFVYNNRFYMDFPRGAYDRPLDIGGGGRASVPFENIQISLNIAAAYIVYGRNIAGVDGTARTYAYTYGNIVSESNLIQGTHYAIRVYLPFTPIIGFLMYYNSSTRLRDITVFAPDNIGSKAYNIVNFNQAMKNNLYSSGWNQWDEGFYFGQGNCIFPVAYPSATYQYWIMGYN